MPVPGYLIIFFSGLTKSDGTLFYREGKEKTRQTKKPNGILSSWKKQHHGGCSMPAPLSQISVLSRGGLCVELLVIPENGASSRS
jgi:hypothetical protein